MLLAEAGRENARLKVLNAQLQEQLQASSPQSAPSSPQSPPVLLHRASSPSMDRLIKDDLPTCLAHLVSIGETLRNKRLDFLQSSVAVTAHHAIREQERMFQHYVQHVAQQLQSKCADDAAAAAAHQKERAEEVAYLNLRHTTVVQERDRLSEAFSSLKAHWKAEHYELSGEMTDAHRRAAMAEEALLAGKAKMADVVARIQSKLSAIQQPATDGDDVQKVHRSEMQALVVAQQWRRQILVTKLDTAERLKLEAERNLAEEQAEHHATRAALATMQSEKDAAAKGLQDLMETQAELAEMQDNEIQSLQQQLIAAEEEAARSAADFDTHKAEAAATISALHATHQKVLQEAASQLETMQAEHVSSMASLHADHIANAEKAQLEHAALLRDAQVEHASSLEKMQQEHHLDIENLKMEHVLALKLLKVQIGSDVEQAQKDHASALEALKLKTEEEMASLRSEHASLVQTLETNHRQALQSEHEHAEASRQKELAELNEAHDVAVQALEAAKKREVAEALFELETSQIAALQQLEAVRQADLEQWCSLSAAEQAAALAELDASHKKTLEDLRKTHEVALATLCAEHADVLRQKENEQRSTILTLEEKLAETLLEQENLRATQDKAFAKAFAEALVHHSIAMAAQQAEASQTVQQLLTVQSQLAETQCTIGLLRSTAAVQRVHRKQDMQVLYTLSFQSVPESREAEKTEEDEEAFVSTIASQMQQSLPATPRKGMSLAQLEEVPQTHAAEIPMVKVYIPSDPVLFSLW